MANCAMNYNTFRDSSIWVRDTGRVRLTPGRSQRIRDDWQPLLGRIPLWPTQTKILGGPWSEYLLQKQRNSATDLNERICTKWNAVDAKQEELPTAVDNRNDITWLQTSWLINGPACSRQRTCSQVDTLQVRRYRYTAVKPRAHGVFTGKNRGATTFSKLEVQFLGLCYYTEQNMDGIPSFVHCIVLRNGKKVGVVHPNFWGSGPPDLPSGCAHGKKSRHRRAKYWKRA